MKSACPLHKMVHFCVVFTLVYVSSILQAKDEDFEQDPNKLESLIAKEKSYSKRKEYVADLVKIGKKALPALERLITSESLSLKCEVAAGLGLAPESCKQEAATLCAGLLLDEDDNVRKGAAWSLVRIGKDAKDVVPQLVNALKDVNHDVRSSVIQALSALGKDAVQALPTLATMATQDDRGNIRCSAVRAIGKIQGEKTAEDLVVNAIQYVSRDDVIIHKGEKGYAVSLNNTKVKDSDVSWGTAVNGLQIGLYCPKTQDRELPRVRVFFKNAGTSDLILNLRSENCVWHGGGGARMFSSTFGPGCKVADFCPIKRGCKISYSPQIEGLFLEVGTNQVSMGYSNKNKTAEMVGFMRNKDGTTSRHVSVVEHHEDTWVGSASSGTVAVTLTKAHAEKILEKNKAVNW